MKVFRVLLISIMVSPFSIVNAAEDSETSISPEFTYRASALSRREDAAYAQSFHKDFHDQLYGSIRFHRQVDFVHDVVIEPTIRSDREDPSKFQFLLEEGYIDSLLGRKVWLTVGKKSEYRGSGFFLQPSDLLNEYKDLFDTLYQKEGRPLLRLQWRGESASLGFGFIPKRGRFYREGNLWASGHLEFLETELQFQVKHDLSKQGRVWGLSLARFFGEHIELHFDGQFRSFQSDPDELLPITDTTAKGESRVNGFYLWRKYSVFCSDRIETDTCGGKDSAYYLGGTRIVLTPRRTIVLEGIVQENGLSTDEFERLLIDQENTETGKQGKAPVPRSIRGRSYGAISYSDDDSIRGVHLGFSYLHSILDQSGFGNISIKRHFSSATSIEFLPTFWRGENHTEFGEMPFSVAYSFLVRGRF